MSGKYETGTFGYWWTVVKGEKDIKGGIYHGGIDCSEAMLTSLYGSPKKIIGCFDCSKNKIETLKHCPSMIVGFFNCEFNQLTNLEYCPVDVEYSFDCSHNQLASLEHDCVIGGKFISHGQKPATTTVKLSFMNNLWPELNMNIFAESIEFDSVQKLKEHIISCYASHFHIAEFLNKDGMKKKLLDDLLPKLKDNSTEIDTKIIVDDILNDLYKYAKNNVFVHSVSCYKEVILRELPEHERNSLYKTIQGLYCDNLINDSEMLELIGLAEHVYEKISTSLIMSNEAIIIKSDMQELKKKIIRNGIISDIKKAKNENEEMRLICAYKDYLVHIEKLTQKEANKEIRKLNLK